MKSKPTRLSGIVASLVLALTVFVGGALPAQAATATLSGVDISRWQGNIDISGAGDFVIVKAGGSDIGYAYSDPKYSANAAKVRASGKLLGHYWYNGYGSGASDADYFVSHLQNYQSGDPLVFDAEGSFISPSKTYAFLARVRELLGDDANIYVYMSSSVTRSYNWSAIVELGAKLWVANYGSNNGSYNYSPTIKYWSDWSIHQYTSVGRISSYSGNIDRNVATATAWNNAVASQVNSAATNVTTATTTTSDTYTVQSGDYLIKIAAKYGISWSTLASLNGLTSPYIIYPGQVLKVSGSTTTSSSSSSSSSGSTYTVQSGDYLIKIAAKTGIGWKTIANLNGLSSPYTIYPGQVLTLSGSSSAATSSSSGNTYYTVKSGDCLSTIAAEYGVTWTSIASLNGLSSPYTIYPGESLRIK
jgi:LysM repeat protein